MKQIGPNVTGRPDPWNLPVKNTTGETIPPHSVMQIVGATPIGTNTLYNITKPLGIQNAKYLINSPAEIPGNGEGWATDQYPTVAATIATAIESQEWGPVFGSWSLSVDGKGFLILGGAVPGLARVAAIPPAAGAGADFPVFFMRNDSGVPRLRRSVFRAGVSLTPPPDNPVQPTFASLPPQEGEPFHISFADVDINGIVDVAPVGIVGVQLNFTHASHKKAECITNDYTKLKSVIDGPATIIWRELQHVIGPASLGLQWSFVLLDRGGGGGEIFTAQIDSSIMAGSPVSPQPGQGEVFRVKAGGATESLGVKTLYNPFVIEASGECTVDNIEGDDHLILGLRGGNFPRAVVKFTATVPAATGDRTPGITSSYTVKKGNISGPLENWSLKSIPNGFYGYVLQIGGGNVIGDAYC